VRYRLMSTLVLSVVLSVATGPGGAALPIDDPLTKDIMSDEIFMEGGWHMRVEGVQETEGRLTVTTTGTIFEFSPSTGKVLCSQRLARQRQSVLLRFPEESLVGLKVTAQGSGAIILESDQGIEFKVNCDSLLMIRAKDEAEVSCRVLWRPAQVYPSGAHRLLLDPYGAVGLFPIGEAALVGEQEAKSEYTYTLSGSGMLWASVGPPRPYDWEMSLQGRLIWHYANSRFELGVPSNKRIDQLKEKGNILWLQGGLLLWQTGHDGIPSSPMHIGFEPRLPREFQRVIDYSHQVGLRVVAYASPFYFIKGLGEGKAASPTGQNVADYLACLSELLEDYPDLDGIYFDGVYPRSVKNTYIVCRATRELLGDDRILHIHCTSNAPGGLCYNPAADTWADFILRGEGQGFRSQQWLRYFVSGYNISNAIGVVCNNAGYWVPTKEQVEMTLRANARLAYMPSEPEEYPLDTRYTPEGWADIWRRHEEAMKELYWPQLTESYRAWVEEVNAGFAE